MSTISADTITTRAGIEVDTTKAWARIDNGTTPAADESLGVSSITDTGVGIRGVNLSNSMATSTYPTHVTGSGNDAIGCFAQGDHTTSFARANVWDASATAYQDAYLTFSALGDLA